MSNEGANALSVVTFFFFYEILQMVYSSKFCLEEPNKATASNLTFVANQHICIQYCHIVCIIIQLPCIKCILFNPKK